MSRIAVIGSGFAGLSAASYLGKAGHEVHVYERNSTPGGRARQLITKNGYTFDMGPSWYWMPDVFERYFADFGFSTASLYHLKKLDPAFSVVYEKHEKIEIPDDFYSLCLLFESIERGSADRLIKFMDEAAYKYKTGMEDLVYKSGRSLMDYADPKLIKGLLKLQVFTSFSRHVRKYFKDPLLIALMEFPVLFLGAMPSETPALYSLMNYAGLMLGTWYPEGGFGVVIRAMVQVATLQGVRIHYNSEVTHIPVRNGKASGLIIHGEEVHFDAVVAAADYHHVESALLHPEYRNYSEKYWTSRILAPSFLIFYIGVKQKVNGLRHHTLFFDENLEKHSDEIYKNPSWPSKPLFYVCCTSKTDPGVAPAGHENLFLLMPIAPGLEDKEETRQTYYDILMTRLEHHTGEPLREHVDFKESYCIKDFTADYNSLRGNAYGLANTLRQTGFLKPSVHNRKVHNLFYAGQLTVPGPGVPPALISGKIAATEVLNTLKRSRDEVNL